MRISDWSSDVCSSDLDPSRRDAPPHGAHMNTSIFRTTALALSTLLFVAACQPSGNQAQTGEANAPGANAPADAGDKIAANSTGAGAPQIGRASGRERVCPTVWNPVGAYT